jgi:flagellar basal-body rod modification protein FlgD
MDVTQTTAVSTQSTLTTQAASNSQISSDFETFLRMLTVQMQNQDPLNPVDSSDYAVQLATFSNVEQQVQTNDILRELQGQMGVSGIAQMADWVGKEARSTAPIKLDGAPITIFPSPAHNAQEADIVVKDSSGLEVTRFTIPAEEGPVEWAGVTEDGYPFPAGQYSFTVESYDGDVLLESTQAAAYAKVVEIQRTADGGTSVVFAGGATADSNEITAIRDPLN